MKTLFWLNNASLNNHSSSDYSQVEAETTREKNSFAICTALSPSKVLKIPSSRPLLSVSRRKEAVEAVNDIGEDSQSHLNTKQRTSFDSGYAESNSSNGPSEDAGDSKDNAEIQQQPQQRKDLEKLCDKCHRKMSVKFDFDKMETEGDPEEWVLYNCSMCTTPTQDMMEDNK